MEWLIFSSIVLLYTLVCADIVLDYTKPRRPPAQRLAARIEERMRRAMRENPEWGDIITRDLVARLRSKKGRLSDKVNWKKEGF